MRISDLKWIRDFIRMGDYTSAVNQAAACGLPCWHYIEEGEPNTCEYWEIRYPLDKKHPTLGEYCTLLDAAYTSGMAGLYRLEGRWS